MIFKCNIIFCSFEFTLSLHLSILPFNVERGSTAFAVVQTLEFGECFCQIYMLVTVALYFIINVLCLYLYL